MDAAWIGLVPATLLLLVALLWLAEPLSDLLYPKPSLHFFPSVQSSVHPEPVEGARYLLAILAPFLLAACVVWLGTRDAGIRSRSATVDRMLVAVQGVGLGFVVVCMLKQKDAPIQWLVFLDYSRGVFSFWNWIGAIAFGAVAVAFALGVWRERLAAFGRRVRSIADNRGVAFGVAAIVTVLWLLPSILTEASLPQIRLTYIEAVFDEYLAVLNGLTPMVDFIPVYNFLLPVLSAPVLGRLGDSVTSFTVLMVFLSSLGLLSIYGMLVNAAGRRDIGLGLYVAVLGIGLFPYVETGSERFGAFAYGNLPARYLGPLVVGWLCTGRLVRSRGGRMAVFLVAGLAALNNAEFGLGCFAAASIALWLGSEGGPPGRRATAGLALEAAAGLGAALLLVSLLTLVRTSSLPDFGLLFYFARIFGREGFALYRMPELGLHIVLYLTFAAAVLAATVRSVTGAPERALTTALAYAGSFGLFAGVYFAGESLPNTLITLFPVWGLATSLLALIALRSLDAARLDTRALRRVLVPAVAVLTALGLMVTTVTKFPAPWSQIERISASGPKRLDVSPAAAFVKMRTSPGEPVVVITELGHKVANKAGVKSVFPFHSPFNVNTFEQIDRVLDAERDAGATKVFVQPGLPPEFIGYLTAQGLTVVSVDPLTKMTELRVR